MLHAKQKQDVEKRTIQKNGVSPLNLGAANEQDRVHTEESDREAVDPF